MVLFKDLNKPAADLLIRDFTHERPWEVEFKHYAKNPMFTQSAFVSNSNLFDALSSVKYLGQDGGYVEAKMGTSTTLLDAVYTSPFMKGALLGGRFERKAPAGKETFDTVDLSAEYIAPDEAFHGRATFNPLTPGWSASGLLGFRSGRFGFTRLGGEMTGTGDVRDLQYSLGGSVTAAGKDTMWIGSLKTFPANGRSIGKVVGHLHAKTDMAGASELAAEVAHSIADAKTSVSFGGLWFLDNGLAGKSRDTVLKAKLSHDGKVASSITHRFSNSLAVTLGAQLDGAKATTDPTFVKGGFKFFIAA